MDTTAIDEAVAAFLAEHPPDRSRAEEFWGAQFDAGLAFPHFPIGLGGLGLDRRGQRFVQERLRAAGASLHNWERNVVGLGMGAPTLAAHATPELQQRLLRPLFTCAEIWCQLFSEPGAGSDLAGLATQVVRDGDEWVANGQKVWTTLAHEARWGLLLARSDPSVPKHRGLTYFVVDMRAPGVEVRPLYEMTGEAEFNEVFLTDVRIPDANRLGAVGDGWSVAMTTLMNERVAVGDGADRSTDGIAANAIAVWKRRGEDDPARLDELMRVVVRARVLVLTTKRASALAAVGAATPHGSITKLMWAELNQAASELALDQLGAEGMLFPDGYVFARPAHSSVNTDSPWKAFLRSRANSIEGGTSEVMRNILGERVLGLSAEPRDDRHVPWKDVPRSAG